MARRLLVPVGCALAALTLAACGANVSTAPATVGNQAAKVVQVQQPAQAAQPASAAAASSQSAMAGMSMPPSASASAAPAAPAQSKVYDPVLAPAKPETVHEITMTARDTVQQIAPGVNYAAWTFEGTAPGPVIHVKQGDTVNFTLKNASAMPHSIDFHAAETPWNLNYRSINPGESLSFSFKADHAGAFMYHCGSAPAIMHIADGMYGAIIVDPATPLPQAKEYVLVQSEFYTKQGSVAGVLDGDYAKMENGKPDFVVFNGMANQYMGDNALTANPGQRIRLWVVNAGPNDFSAFHVVGAILDKVYPDGNPANVLSGMQTYTVPPGGGAMVELTIPNEGWYPVVSHSFADASKGATAMIKVGNPPPPSGGH